MMIKETQIIVKLVHLPCLILVLINLFFAGFSSMTVTTRIGFAMARDGAFPGSNFLYNVTKKNKVPLE
jgi:amino acid transporter